jgi:hypothetical protein
MYTLSNELLLQQLKYTINVYAQVYTCAQASETPACHLTSEVVLLRYVVTAANKYTA